MYSRDRGIGIFLLIISALLCYGAIRLGIGKSNNPGPGFFPFLAGMIIFALSLVIIITSVRSSPRISPQMAPFFTIRTGLILGALFLFGLFVEKAGFFICTFFATLMILRANRIKNWFFLIFVSLLICIGIFLVFNLLLEVRLPLGILKFN